MLQIENNKNREEAEAAKFELTNKVFYHITVNPCPAEPGYTL